MVAISVCLAGVAVAVHGLRGRYIAAVTTYDAPPGDAPELPQRLLALPGERDDSGLPPAPRVRVVLVDGAGAETARAMPAWNALCGRGLDLAVDVGFPTVSLPVQIALWSGRTQQQTGVLFHTGRALATPLDAAAIPAQVPGSLAVAEEHPEIVRSLGFARTLPDPAEPVAAGRRVPAAWDARWTAEALTAVASEAPLAFVHILGVDAAGHRKGRRSAEWTTAAAAADHVLAMLIAARPDARWFVLADHGHLPGGGHGGEERAIRVVRGCIAGDGLRAERGGPIALVDVSRAIADSVGARLPADSAARPLWRALSLPIDDGALLPGVPLGRAGLALALLAAGIVATLWGSRRRLEWAPWWWLAALALLVLVEGVPTLSTPMIYKPRGQAIYLAASPALVALAAWAALGFARREPLRVVAALLAVPAAAWLAAVTASGGWAPLAGAAVAPIVPRWTAWASALAVVLATAAAVVALAALATAVRPSSGPRAPRAAPRSAP